MELKEELPLHRLSCGCLVRCNDEGGGEWIEHKKCTTDGIHHCEIDEYVARHRVCLFCGRCIICFEHNKCRKNTIAKLLTLVSSFIVFPIYDFIDYIKYKFRRKDGNKK